VALALSNLSLILAHIVVAATHGVCPSLLCPCRPFLTSLFAAMW
jgi:hypothetical protein